MTEPRISTISIEGSLDIGLPEALSPSATYGPVELWHADDGVRFRVTVRQESPADYMALIRRMQLATEAAVLAITGISASARGDIGTYLVDGRPAVTRTRSTAGVYVVTGDPEAAQRQGTAAAEAVLSADERLGELWEVHLLGIRAIRSVASPVVGLWAFSTVIEEETPGTLRFARTLADELRADGYVVPANPDRSPAAIRTAALHPSPKAPLPTFNEVEWFQFVAQAYLDRRAGESRVAPTLRKSPTAPQ